MYLPTRGWSPMHGQETYNNNNNKLTGYLRLKTYNISEIL